jgi:hypothetical protein
MSVIHRHGTFLHDSSSETLFLCGELLNERQMVLRSTRPEAKITPKRSHSLKFVTRELPVAIIRYASAEGLLAVESQHYFRSVELDDLALIFLRGVNIDDGDAAGKTLFDRRHMNIRIGADCLVFVNRRQR